MIFYIFFDKIMETSTIIIITDINNYIYKGKLVK